MEKKNTLHRSEPPRDVKRERILAEATRLFAATGFAATSSKAICEAAGVNLASLSTHFASKETLYREIAGRFGDQGLDRVRRVLQPAQNARELRERLSLFVDSSLDLMLGEAGAAQIVLRDLDFLSRVGKDIFESTYLEIHRALVQFLENARRHGLTRADLDAPLAADAMFDHLAAAMREREIPRRFWGRDLAQPADRARWTAGATAFFLGGIGAQR